MYRGFGVAELFELDTPQPLCQISYGLPVRSGPVRFVERCDRCGDVHCLWVYLSFLASGPVDGPPRSREAALLIQDAALHITAHAYTLIHTRGDGVNVTKLVDDLPLSLMRF